MSSTRAPKRHSSGSLWSRARDRDLRPLDPVRSIKAKLGYIIVATVVIYMIVTWAGLRFGFGVLRTFPVAFIASLLVTQILARGMTRPLREMTAAAGRMAQGDYSTRVTTNSQDEVGELAAAFNSMAADLDSLDAQRREMVANVSHELRTPVAALRAQMENLADGVIEPDPAALEAALAQTERLSRLVSYLLDLSRLEAGAADLSLEEIPLRPFLQDVINDARHTSAKTLTWRVESHPAELTITADEARLRQVLANLLENAVRHSPTDGVVTISARGEGERIYIDVHDEGGGIPKEDRQRIFERFERGNSPTHAGQPTTGGTGLGLAIARWAVGLHGGEIAVVDPPGNIGALIRVSLPAAPPTA